MSQLTNEQRERLEQVRVRQARCMRPDRDDVPQEPHVRAYYRELRRAEMDRGFLLSLIDSKAAEGDYEQLAHEIISEYKNGDDPGLLRSKVAEGFAQVADSAASAMRDKCVATLRQIAADYDSVAQPNNGAAISKQAVLYAARQIESLTLDPASGDPL